MKDTIPLGEIKYLLETTLTFYKIQYYTEIVE